MTDRELAGCALLPCPFCGGTSLTVYADGVWCEQCPARHDVDPPSEAEAIAAWNRRTPSSEGDGIPQVEGLTVEREAGALSQSGERFPDLFVIRLGDREDCVIKGEQPALWAMFDAAIAAAEGGE